jgi:hypothetical protein
MGKGFHVKNSYTALSESSFFTQDRKSIHMSTLLKMPCLVPNRVGDPIKDNDMKRFLSLTLVVAASLMSGCSYLKLSPDSEPKDVAPNAAADRRALEPTSMITPMSEKRETLMATGYAVISIQNHRNPAQQRLLAIRASKLDAYRALTEQVYGQQLDASTTVADMTVMSDTFRARVEGVVYGAVLVSITPVGDDTYETTMSLDRNLVNDLRALYIAHLNSRRR